MKSLDINNNNKSRISYILFFGFFYSFTQLPNLEAAQLLACSSRTLSSISRSQIGHLAILKYTTMILNDELNHQRLLTHPELRPVLSRPPQVAACSSRLSRLKLASHRGHWPRSGAELLASDVFGDDFEGVRSLLRSF